MVSSDWAGGQPDLYLTTSVDGINWAPRQAVVTDVGEQFYPTLIGTGADPTHTGQSFYVYYTDSRKGAWNRWKDAQLVRRQITLDPYIAPAPPIPPLGPDSGGGPAPPQPTPTDWASMASFRADYQTESPAAGWHYAWNPSRVRGNASLFAPLTWSDMAQAYNTTGVGTAAPGSKNHSDDYLYLASWGGHPGRSNYSTVVGYTIQEEDGDGTYRLADTSIQKADGITSANEDPLGVLVYINNSLLGPLTTVSTNGSLTSFDRDLGELNVGDTVWVMIDSLKTQNYDSYTNFDFAIQKSVPAIMAMSMSLPAMAFSASSTPEPDPLVLILVGAAAYGLRQRRRGG
jgi:MYXO-CTERM domain-containing protein